MYSGVFQKLIDYRENCLQLSDCIVMVYAWTVCGFVSVYWTRDTYSFAAWYRLERWNISLFIILKGAWENFPKYFQVFCYLCSRRDVGCFLQIIQRKLFQIVKFANITKAKLIKWSLGLKMKYDYVPNENNRKLGKLRPVLSSWQRKPNNSAFQNLCNNNRTTSLSIEHLSDRNFPSF